MKNSVALLAVAVFCASAFAQEVPRPLDPTSRATVGGGSYQTPGHQPVPGPGPTPRRPDVRPQPQPRPEPRRPEPRNDECEVIMVDAYNRVVFRYTGLADRPSGLCRGPITRCQQDIFAERIYGGICYQTIR